MKDVLEMLLAFLLMAVGIAASWGITTGVYYLICLCFKWNFSLPIATGIWLVLALVSSFFKRTPKSEE